jgi:hypothetical protein
MGPPAILAFRMTERPTGQAVVKWTSVLGIAEGVSAPPEEGLTWQSFFRWASNPRGGLTTSACQRRLALSAKPSKSQPSRVH